MKGVNWLNQIIFLTISVMTNLHRPQMIFLENNTSWCSFPVFIFVEIIVLYDYELIFQIGHCIAWYSLSVFKHAYFQLLSGNNLVKRILKNLKVNTSQPPADATHLQLVMIKKYMICSVYFNKNLGCECYQWYLQRKFKINLFYDNLLLCLLSFTNYFCYCITGVAGW